MREIVWLLLGGQFLFVLYGTCREKKNPIAPNKPFFWPALAVIMLVQVCWLVP
jgi:uncharacterized membrane protein